MELNGQPSALEEARPEPGGGQVFVNPSRRRTVLARWLGRGVAGLVLAYLVVLGASLARAPWAPSLSLPGLGSITAPALVSEPPHLGSRAVTSPVPAGVVRASTRAPAGSGGSSPTGGVRSGVGATTTSAPSGATNSTSTTTKTSSTSSTAVGQSSTTTTSTTTTTTTPGRSSTTTSTTRPSNPGTTHSGGHG